MRRHTLLVAAVLLALVAGLGLLGASVVTHRTASPVTVPMASGSAAPTSPTSPTSTATGARGTGGRAAYRIAVIGDLPYGADQLALLPRWVEALRAAEPTLVVHLGDLKDSASPCSTAYFTTVRDELLGAGPLLLTPGDNDWADCHRGTAGGFTPLERLATLRRLFYPDPRHVLGSTSLAVTPDPGFPENVRFRLGRVGFATLHLVGSENGLEPWTGLDEEEPTAAQRAEVAARTASAVRVLEAAFAAARTRHDSALVVFTQADLFVGSGQPALAPVVHALAAGAARYGGPVYLVNGDSHGFVEGERPLRGGSPWLRTYAVPDNLAVLNLQRITVDGSENANAGWLTVTVGAADVGSPVGFERVPWPGGLPSAFPSARQ